MKDVADHIERAPSAASATSVQKAHDVRAEYVIDPKAERRLLRKLDVAILPLTVLMYLSAQLDVSVAPDSHSNSGHPLVALC